MSTFNFAEISANIGKVLTAKEGNVSAASKLDLTDPANLIKFQQAISEWNNMTNLSSGLIKTLSDANSGIIQKM